MKKYGFTLVELMGVIIILGVIALIAIPVVDRQLKESKNDLHQTQKENIKEAAKLWTAKNIYKLPADGESCYIKYSDLVDGGFLDEKLKDPKTNTTFTDDNVNIKIEKDTKYNKYTYDVIIGSNSDEKVYCTDIIIVTFDANGGKLDFDSKPVAYHSTYGELPTPTRDGYTFLGWNGRNLYNVNDINRITDGVTVSNNDYITINTSSGAQYYNYWTHNLNVLTNTDYLIMLETGEIKNQVGNLYVTSQGGTYQFQNTLYSANQLETNHIYMKKTKTSSNVTYNYGIRTFYGNVKDNNNQYYTNTILTFRISVLDVDDTITQSNFEYEPYYITPSTVVVQDKDHTLTAVWQEIE